MNIKKYDVTKEDLEENDNVGEELQCPKCVKSFGVLSYLELLDHISTCSGNE